MMWKITTEILLNTAESEVISENMKERLEEDSLETTTGTSKDNLDTNEGENDDAERLDVLEDRSVDEQVKHDSITIVHAVGVFRNSPNEALGQDDLDSLKKYILIIFTETSKVLSFFKLASGKSKPNCSL